MTTAVVIGATGLIGAELVKVLLATPYYETVLLLNRRPSGVDDPRLSERIIDFDAPQLDGVFGEHLYCALGTTSRKAGSQAEQFKVDCEYPTRIATMLRERGTRQMIVVSSIGADTRSLNFYTRTKGQLEENLIALEFNSTVIVRPSFLRGKRSELRTGEAFAIGLLDILSPLMIGSLEKYRAVDARDVARRMVREATSGGTGVRVIEFP